MIANRFNSRSSSRWVSIRCIKSPPPEMKLSPRLPVINSRPGRTRITGDLLQVTPGLQPPGDLLNLVHDPKQVATPQLADLLFVVASPDQLQRDVERLAGVVPAVHAPAAVEVRADPHV